MSVLHTIRSFIPLLGPKWLTRDKEVGPAKVETDSRALYTLGLYYDATYDRVKRGIEQRFPGGGAALDALAYLARDRQIPRGPAESRASWEKRLQRAWDDWQLAGHPYALLEQLRAYLSPLEIKLATVDNHGTWFILNADGTRAKRRATAWNWDGSTTQWSRFWVLMYMSSDTPQKPWAQLPDFDDTELWDDAIQEDDTQFTIGSTATYDEVVSVQSIVRAWKPAGTTCVNIAIVFEDTGAFTPESASPPLPDGTWGHWSINDAGVQVASRDPGAEYWDG